MLRSLKSGSLYLDPRGEDELVEITVLDELATAMIRDRPIGLVVVGAVGEIARLGYISLSHTI